MHRVKKTSEKPTIKMSEEQAEAPNVAPPQGQGQEQVEAPNVAPPQVTPATEEKKNDEGGPSSVEGSSFRFPSSSPGATEPTAPGLSGNGARVSVNPDWSPLLQDLVRDKQTTAGVGAVLHTAQTS